MLPTLNICLKNLYYGSLGFGFFFLFHEMKSMADVIPAYEACFSGVKWQ